METIRLLPTRGPGISFEGDLVFHVAGNRDDDLTTHRCHDISLFRKPTDDQWVVRIEYHTSAPKEKTVTDVEVVDTLEDVELVLQMYQPNAYVDRAGLRGLYEEARRRINRHLFANYDRQVHHLLKTLTDRGLWQIDAVTVADKE